MVDCPLEAAEACLVAVDGREDGMAGPLVMVAAEPVHLLGN